MPVRALWNLYPVVLVGGAVLAIVVTALFASVRHHASPAAAAATASALAGGPAAVARQTAGKPSTNPEAEELYLRGMYLWNQRTEASLDQAIDLFTQSIVHDPNFAAAYAGLADSYLLLRQYGPMKDAEAFPRGLAACRQALALDDASPAAHRAYGFVLNYWMWDFPAAEREFKRSIELRPDDALTHSWYATSLYSAGRYPEAMREIETARRLAPDSNSILANRGLLLGALDPAAATAYLHDLERANASFPPIHTYLATIEFRAGEYRESLEESRRAAQLRQDATEIALLDAAGKQLAQRGPEAMLGSLAAGYGRLVDSGRPNAMLPASLYARLQDRPRTLHYLKLSCDRREAYFLAVDQDASFRFLAGDPEFRALLVRRQTPLDLATALKTTT